MVGVFCSGDDLRLLNRHVFFCVVLSIFSAFLLLGVGCLVDVVRFLGVRRGFCRSSPFVFLRGEAWVLSI